MKRIATIFSLGLALGFSLGKFSTLPLSTVDRSPELVALEGTTQTASSSPRSDLRSPSSDTFLVSRVIDGDTIELENKEKVRYIGINTPETVDPRRAVQCFGHEASAKNKELVEGKQVTLVVDIEDRDKYGRLLRYVYLQDATFVNLELIKQGYASVATYPPNVAHVDAFKAAEKSAREAKVGLWGECK